ncbi:hypothetical protein [Bradyrhizobium sp. LMG 9283]|uniref:hypothetical protein n=1 Tax=Bradyrhizobium sp. LMG 9283 TaxID=592064 RepID=UPI00388F17DD
MTVQQDAFAPAKAVARGEGIELDDFRQLFMRQWRWAAATFVIVAVIAIVPLSWIKPQWEAQATVRIGQVFDAFANSPRLVESLQDVQERMRTNSFLRDALKISEVSPGAATARVSFVSAKIDPVPSTALIRITVRASTADASADAVTAIFEQLKSVHEELARTARSEVGLLAEQYATELAGLREVQSKLEKAFASASNSGADDGSSAMASLAPAIERNARGIWELDRQRFLLVRRDKYQSAPTEMMGRTSSVRIGGASRGLIILFGIVMGLAAGIVFAMLRDYVVRRRSQPLSA